MIYQVSNKNRLLVFLLCVVILFNSFFVAVETADASITLTAGTLAVLCSALVASGFVFQNSDELSKAASSLWSSLSETQREFFVTSGTTYLDYVTSNEPFVVKLSKDICGAIGSWLGSLGATADAPSVSIPISGSLPMTLNWNDIPYLNSSSWKNQYDTYLNFLLGNISSAVQIADYVYIFKVGADSSSMQLTVFVTPEFTHSLGWSGRTSGLNLKIDGVSWHPASMDCVFTLSLSDSSYNVIALDSSGTQIGSCTSFAESAFYLLFPSASSGSVSIPWTGGYAPGYEGEKELDDSTGIVVPGKLIHDGVIDSDFVGTLTPDAVRETSTDVPSDGILDWVKSIAETLGKFFDVSEFTLDFSPFEIGLSKVFPFCIPFDFYNGIKLFSAQAADFSFDIKLDTDYFKIDHTVNLTPFKLPILFFRYIVVFWFSWILISRTRDLMKW